MRRVSVNGKSFDIVGGNNVSIINGKVIVDGKEISDNSKDRKIEIKLEGCTVEKLYCDESLTIHGEIKGDADAQGSMNCDTIHGNANCGGSLKCDDIGGNASAGGSIQCDDVGGSISAGGSVRHG